MQYSRASEHLGALRVALMKVLEQADKLSLCGWQVNFQQNVQWALRGSRFGLSGCSLVERYQNLPARTTLSERLEVIGSTIFYKQKRKAGELQQIEPMLLSEQLEDKFGSIFLSLNSSGRRYTSDWIDNARGESQKLLAD